MNWNQFGILKIFAFVKIQVFIFKNWIEKNLSKHYLAYLYFY